MNEVRNVLVGFELGKEESQLSYYNRNAQEPVSVPTKVGTNLFRFPTVLAKKRGREEWHFGLEAEYFGTRDDFDLVWGEEILGTEDVDLPDKSYTPTELLAAFIGESLRLLGLRDLTGSISCVMVTMESLPIHLVTNIRSAFDSLGFSHEQYSLQNSMESFYYYAYSQKPGFWARDVALFMFEEDRVSFRALREDATDKPQTVRVISSPPATLSEDLKIRDLQLLEYATKNMSNGSFSGVLITGTGFDMSWPEKSIRYMCRAAKVYYGDNLFVKGACYAAYEHMETHALRGKVYMSEDLVRMSIGMDMLVKGKAMYIPLIVAGSNWFDAANEIEFILDDRRELVFILSSLDEKKRRKCMMDLPDLPERPNRATRIRLNLFCSSADVCHVRAEDLGFGGFFPATHKVWEDTIPLETFDDE